jgi:hypothetical protein
MGFQQEGEFLYEEPFSWCLERTELARGLALQKKIGKNSRAYWLKTSII